jgi:multidrug transporter EmrE-like cation transporter
MSKYYLLWYVPLIISEACALYCIKEYNISKNIIFLVGGILLYASISIYLSQILNGIEDISIANAFWNVSSNLYGLLIGLLIFSEDLSWSKIGGIFLGSFSIFLMLF